jgi:hypothetical protein
LITKYENTPYNFPVQNVFGGETRESMKISKFEYLGNGRTESHEERAV